MSDTLFADPAEPAAPADPAQPAPTPTIEIPAAAAELIGEGKKYATVEAALASIPNAQEHISTIEAENAEYKNALLTNDKLESVLDKLNNPDPAPVVTAPVEGIKPEDVSTLVQQEIARTAQVTQEKANLDVVESELRKANGEKVGEVFNTKAQALGISPTDLTNLAKKSPQAVLALFNDNKSAAPSHTSDGVNLSTVGDIGDTPIKKNIMFGASTAEVIDEWRQSAPIEE